MFSFLKKLLSKDEPPEEVTIDHKDLRKWFDEQSKSIVGKEEASIKGFLSDLAATKARAEETLKVLKSAELKNKNIPQKHIQLLEGNRQAYLQKMQAFFDEVHIEPTFEGLKVFTQELDATLQALTKSTTKSYTILQEFFANEAYKVAAIVKEVDTLKVRIKEYIEDSHYGRYRKVLLLFDEKDAIEARKAAHTKDVSSRKAIIASLEADRKKNQEEKARIKKSKPYLDQQQAKHRKAELLEERRKLRSEMVTVFGRFGKALRKFGKTSIESGLSLAYADNPLKALEKDKDFSIMSTLDKVASLIDEGRIDVKNPQKMTQAIRQVGKDQLLSWSSRREAIDDELAKIAKRPTPPEIETLHQLVLKLPLIEQDIKRETLLLEKEASQSVDAEPILQSILNECRRLFNKNVTLT